MVTCLIAAVIVFQAPPTQGQPPAPAPAPPAANNPPSKKLLEAPRLAPVVVKDARTNYLRGVEEAPAPAEAPPADDAAAPAADTGATAIPPGGGDPPEAWPSSNAPLPAASPAPAMAIPAPAAPPPAAPAGNALAITIAAIAAIVMIIGPAIGARWALGRQLPPRAD